MEQARFQKAILDVAGLIRDGVEISGALIAGEWEEARFLSRMIAADAATLGLMDAYAAAIAVSQHLGVSGRPLSAAYAQALLDLSEALARALESVT
jgi:hypothetical protein